MQMRGETTSILVHTLTRTIYQAFKTADAMKSWLYLQRATC